MQRWEVYTLATSRSWLGVSSSLLQDTKNLLLVSSLAGCYLYWAACGNAGLPAMNTSL